MCVRASRCVAHYIYCVFHIAVLIIYLNNRFIIIRNTRSRGKSFCEFSKSVQLREQLLVGILSFFLWDIFCFSFLEESFLLFCTLRLNYFELIILYLSIRVRFVYYLVFSWPRVIADLMSLSSFLRPWAKFCLTTRQ